MQLTSLLNSILLTERLFDVSAAGHATSKIWVGNGPPALDGFDRYACTIVIAGIALRPKQLPKRSEGDGKGAAQSIGAILE